MMETIKCLEENEFLKLLKQHKPIFKIVRWKPFWTKHRYWFFINREDYETLKVIYESFNYDLELEKDIEKMGLIVVRGFR